MVQWLKSYAQEVDSDQLVSMFEQDWERTMKKSTDQASELEQAAAGHAPYVVGNDEV